MATDQIFIIFKILILIVVCCQALPTEKENNTMVSKAQDILEGIKDSKSIDNNGLHETLNEECDSELTGRYFQGDMIIRRTYNGAISPSMRWPNAIVYYKLSSAFDEGHASLILKAMKLIESRSCVRFRPASSATKAFVHIIGDFPGCFSDIGHTGKEQRLNLHPDSLGTGCFKIGSILHEFLHSLGFYHQHSVPERDKFIKINYQNILRGKERNFYKDSDKVVTSFGVKYDYHSVMHYGAKACSKNGLATIVPLMDNVQIGQRYYLSESDAKKLYLMYKCK